MNKFKKKLKEKIKLYSNKQYLDGYIKKEYLTDDGDADVFMKFNNKDDLIDSRTVHDQIDLVPDIYDFIEVKTSMLENDVKIHLHILGLDLNPHEQGIIKHIIKEHYAIELYKIQKEYVKYRNKIISLILIGLFAFSCYTYLYLYTNLNFFIEVFVFIFSFALWEALDCVIYSFSDVKKQRADITQNLLMNVGFENEEKDINLK